MAHILSTGGLFVFSHKQILNSDLDCITQSMLWRTHKQKYTQSLYNGITTLGGIFISKGSKLKSGHISHSKGEPKHKTHRCEHRYKHTQTLATVNYHSSRKSKLIHGSQETFSCLSSREQLREHIPSTEPDNQSYPCGESYSWEKTNIFIM